MIWTDRTTNKTYSYSWGFESVKENIDALRDMLIERDNKEEINMRMDDMNRRFEKAGFEVSRCYDSINKQYIFTIRRNGNMLERVFKYPFMKTAPGAAKEQNDFIRNMMDDFINKFEKEKKEMPKNNFLTIAGMYGAKATMEIGGSTATVRITSVNNHPLDGVTFECELLHETPYNKMYRNPIPSIKNVIFNDPATIVQWSDGTKTIVKCGENDWYDPEKGLAMAISKKALGNQGNYYTELRKWLKDYVVEEGCGPRLDDFVSALWKLGIKLKVEAVEVEEDLSDKFYTFNDPDIKPEVTIKVEEPAPKPKWEIRYRNAELGTPEEFHNYAYASKRNAERAARRMFGEPDIGHYRWYVTEI